MRPRVRVTKVMQCAHLWHFHSDDFNDSVLDILEYWETLVIIANNF